jgi:hypothetical protein
MSAPREDAICPVCPDPETAFRINDVGMRFDSEPTPGNWSIRASRPLWEPMMLAHLGAEDDEAHRALFAQCSVALRGRSPEEAVRAEIGAIVQSVARRVTDWGEP